MHTDVPITVPRSWDIFKKRQWEGGKGLLAGAGQGPHPVHKDVYGPPHGGWEAPLRESHKHLSSSIRSSGGQCNSAS